MERKDGYHSSLVKNPEGPTGHRAASDVKARQSDQIIGQYDDSLNGLSRSISLIEEISNRLFGMQSVENPVPDPTKMEGPDPTKMEGPVCFLGRISYMNSQFSSQLDYLSSLLDKIDEQV